MEGELRGDGEQVTQGRKASLTKAEGKLSSPAVRAAPHDDSGGSRWGGGACLWKIR